MTFAEVKALVLSQIEPRYISFTWDNDCFSDGSEETVCAIYIDGIGVDLHAPTWDEAYDLFERYVLGKHSGKCSPCPTDEVAG